MENISSIVSENKSTTAKFQDYRICAEIGFQVFALTIFNVVAFFGNLLIIYTIHREPYLQTTTNKIIESLAWTDFLSAVLVNPFFTVSVAKGEWIFGDKLCLIQGFLLVTLAIVTVDTVAVVAINRLLKVVFPNVYNKLFGSSRKTNLIIICVWGLSIFLALLPFIGLKRSYVYDHEYFLCDVVWDRANLAYTTILLFLSGYPATVIITVSYVWIYIEFRRSSKGVRMQAKEEDIQNVCLQNRQQQVETKILMLTVAMVCFFILCWSPIIVLVTIMPHVKAIPARFKTASKIVMSLNSAGNPIIYCAFNTRFRTAFKRILKCNKAGEKEADSLPKREYFSLLNKRFQSIRKSSQTNQN